MVRGDDGWNNISTSRGQGVFRLQCSGMSRRIFRKSTYDTENCSVFEVYDASIVEYLYSRLLLKTLAYAAVLRYVRITV